MSFVKQIYIFPLDIYLEVELMCPKCMHDPLWYILPHRFQEYFHHLHTTSCVREFQLFYILAIFGIINPLTLMLFCCISNGVFAIYILISLMITKQLCLYFLAM